MPRSAVRQSLCIAWLALAGAGCGRGPTPGPRCEKAAPPREASGLHLRPETAAGSLWCFDPDSRALRASLAAPPPDPNDLLDAGDLAADVDFLHEIMRLQYAGYPALVQHRSFDVGAFFAAWKQRLLAGPACVTVDQGAFDAVREMRRAVPDNHHGLVVKGKPDASKLREYQAVLPPGTTLALDRCHVQGPAEPFPETLRTAPQLGRDGTQQIVTVSARGTGEAITLDCPGRSVVLAPRSEMTRAERPGRDEALYTWRAAGDVAVITVRGLAGTGVQLKQLERLAGEYGQHRAYRRILFDFRQNNGGNDAHVYDWIAKAKRGTWDSGAGLQLEGGLFPCWDWNALVGRQIRDGTVDSADGRAERDAVRAQWPPGPRPVRWKYVSGLEVGKAENPFTGRVFVVVDRYSVSSGETGPYALHLALGATLIGERTGGAIEYGNVTTYVLPRTGLRWNLATQRQLIADRLESVGLAVDAYLSNPDAPIEDILPLLDALP